MKKSTLLLTAMAVASTALAATPEVNKHISKVEVEKPAAVDVKMMATQKGSPVSVNALKSLNSGMSMSKAPKKAAGLSVSYEEPYGIFAIGMSEEGIAFQNIAFHKGPAYLPLTWWNTSVGATEYEWEYVTYESGEGDYAYSDERDLEITPIWSQIDPPLLSGVDADGNFDYFMLGGEKDDKGEIVGTSLIYEFGGSCDQWISETETANLGMTTYLYGYKGEGYSYFTELGYNPSAEGFDPSTGLSVLWTNPRPNGVGLENPVFKGYANVFEYPAAPYYISKLWSWMYIKANKATNVEMTLYRIDEEGKISDDIIASGTASVNATSKAEGTILVFDLYSLDEDGLETDEPIVIDSAMLAVMTINKEDFDLFYAMSGTGAQWPDSLEEDPYIPHALLNFELDGEEAYFYNPFGYGIDEKTNLSVTDWIWMVDAVFPWMYEVNGNTVAQAPVEGGEVTFTINSWFDMASLEYLLTEGSDWIDFANASLDIDEDYNQILTVPVDALPEGVEGRSATITTEAPAASLEMTINQGEVDAVNVVVINGQTQYFDLQGRRVANPEKGIFIKKVGNKAEKVIL